MIKPLPQAYIDATERIIANGDTQVALLWLYYVILPRLVRGPA